MQTLYFFNNEKEAKIIRAIMKELYGKDILLHFEESDKSSNKSAIRNKPSSPFLADSAFRQQILQQGQSYKR